MKAGLGLDLPGLIVPPLTPFTPTGEVDYGRLEREVEYILERCGPAAVTVAGVETQEYQYLDEAGRAELIRRTVEFVGGRVPVVVGISHPSVRQALRLAELAAGLGAAAVQVLIPNRPFGGSPSAGEVLRYFELICRETPLPVIAYHNPGPGAEVSAEVIGRLARLEAVVGLKESSRNLRFLGLLLSEAAASGLKVFATMEVLLPALMLGAAGGTMPPPGAALARLLIGAFRAGDIGSAVRFQRLLNVMPARWVGYGLAPVMKASMAALGLDLGEPYPPFGALPEAVRAELTAFWQGLDEEVAAEVRPGPKTGLRR
jgi:4-hydroxy-tetrahydrodipicolinate synthase